MTFEQLIGRTFSYSFTFRSVEVIGEDESSARQRIHFIDSQPILVWEINCPDCGGAHLFFHDGSNVHVDKYSAGEMRERTQLLGTLADLRQDPESALYSDDDMEAIMAAITIYARLGLRDMILRRIVEGVDFTRPVLGKAGAPGSGNSDPHYCYYDWLKTDLKNLFLRLSAIRLNPSISFIERGTYSPNTEKDNQREGLALMIQW
ncbi:MAG: hypothetical protein WCX08_03050 [Candidatus Buchananbacteria bacterium]